MPSYHCHRWCDLGWEFPVTPKPCSLILDCEPQKDPGAARTVTLPWQTVISNFVCNVTFKTDKMYSFLILDVKFFLLIKYFVSGGHVKTYSGTPAFWKTGGNIFVYILEFYIFPSNATSVLRPSGFVPTFKKRAKTTQIVFKYIFLSTQSAALPVSGDSWTETSPFTKWWPGWSPFTLVGNLMFHCLLLSCVFYVESRWHQSS